MTKTGNKMYAYKGFVIKYGGCEADPTNWYVRDFNNYNELVGSQPTDICVTTLKKAKEEIDLLVWARANLPY